MLDPQWTSLMIHCTALFWLFVFLQFYYNLVKLVISTSYNNILLTKVIADMREHGVTTKKISLTQRNTISQFENKVELLTWYSASGFYWIQFGTIHLCLALHFSYTVIFVLFLAHFYILLFILYSIDFFLHCLRFLFFCLLCLM